jgi:predicted GNAT family N-acyltransferase
MSRLLVKEAETQKEIADAFKVRRKVFVEEQKITEDVDLDGKDDEAEHIVAYFNNNPIGCTRIRHVDKGVKIERMVILNEYRGRGFGRFILNYTIALLTRRYPKERIYLHSQKDVEGFYKKAGFVTKGKIFYEAGIPHIMMVLEKKKPLPLIGRMLKERQHKSSN